MSALALALGTLLSTSPGELRLKQAWEVHSRTGDVAALQRAADEETRASPQLALPWLHLANIYLARNDLEAARTAYLGFLERKPAATEAEAARRELTVLEGALRHPPGSARDAIIYELWSGRAIGAFRSGDVAAAATYSERAIALVPVRPEAYVTLGLTLEMGGEHGAAARYYAAAIARSGTADTQKPLEQRLDETLRRERSRRAEQLAVLHLASARQKQAAWSYLEAFEADTSREDLAVTAALLLFASGELLVARDALDRAARLGSPETRRQIAKIRSRATDLKPILDAEGEKLWTLGAEARKQGRASEARKHFERALQKVPTLPRYRFSLVEVLAAEQKRAEALAVLAEAPGSMPLTWSSRGELLLLDQRFQEAADALERAIALEPGRSRHHRLHAQALTGLKRLEDAKKAFETAQALDPTDGQVFLALAQFHTGVDDHAALEAANRAVELLPWAQEAWLTRAELHFRAGRKDQARADSASAGRVSTCCQVLRERLGGQP